MDGRTDWLGVELGWGQMPHPDELRAWLREDWRVRYRCSLWRWMVWGLDAERGLLGWKCLWDIQGTCSETIVLEELVSVNGMDVIP